MALPSHMRMATSCGHGLNQRSSSNTSFMQLLIPFLVIEHWGEYYHDSFTFIFMTRLVGWLRRGQPSVVLLISSTMLIKQRHFKCQKVAGAYWNHICPFSNFFENIAFEISVVSDLNLRAKQIKRTYYKARSRAQNWGRKLLDADKVVKFSIEIKFHIAWLQR